MHVHGWRWLLLALFACADEEHFLPLSELCNARATDVCDARGGCCGVDPETCLKAEQDRCLLALAPYEAESALHYDSVAGARQRAAVRDIVLMCKPAPSLAGFFHGGAPLGAVCERDSQCASGSCAGEPRVCSEPAAAGDLCAP